MYLSELNWSHSAFVWTCPRPRAARSHRVPWRPTHPGASWGAALLVSSPDFIRSLVLISHIAAGNQLSSIDPATCRAKNACILCKNFAAGGLKLLVAECKKILYNAFSLCAGNFRCKPQNSIAPKLTVAIFYSLCMCAAQNSTTTA